MQLGVFCICTGVRVSVKENAYGFPAASCMAESSRKRTSMFMLFSGDN